MLKVNIGSEISYDAMTQAKEILKNSKTRPLRCKKVYCLTKSVSKYWESVQF